MPDPTTRRATRVVRDRSVRHPDVREGRHRQAPESRHRPAATRPPARVAA